MFRRCAVGALAARRLNRRATEEDHRRAALDALFAQDDPADDEPRPWTWTPIAIDDLPHLREESEREAVDLVFEREDWRPSGPDDGVADCALAVAVRPRAAAAVGCVKRTTAVANRALESQPYRRTDRAGERATRRHRGAPFVLAASVLLAAFFGWLALPGSNDNPAERDSARPALAAAFPTELPSAARPQPNGRLVTSCRASLLRSAFSASRLCAFA